MFEFLECRQLIEEYLYGVDNMETLKRFRARNDEGQVNDQSREHKQL